MIEEVLGGTEQPLQRCGTHKVGDVFDELPRQHHGQALNLRRAAWNVRPVRRREVARTTDPISGAGLRAPGAQPARGHGRNVHLAAPCTFPSRSTSAWRRPISSRVRKARRGVPLAQRHMVGARRDGAALGSVRTAAHREALPPTDGHTNLWALAAILDREEKKNDSTFKGELSAGIRKDWHSTRPS
jgi:hypothetical protein